MDARVVLRRAGDREPYHRWAYESAALDLALRQAGQSLAEAVGREPQPVTFVVSPGLGDPPSSEVVRRWLELEPSHRFKLDPATDWTDELIAELAATGAVVTADYKAYYSQPRTGRRQTRSSTAGSPRASRRRTSRTRR